MADERSKSLFLKTNFSKFDNHILELTGGTVNMGVIEVVKRQEREQGLQQGLQQGLEQLEEKNYKVVANLIQQLGLDDQSAAEVAEVSVDFVRKVRAGLEKKRK